MVVQKCSRGLQPAFGVWYMSQYFGLQCRKTMDELKQETSDFPEWVVPMAATLTQERFTGPEWIFERKLDGIRLLAFKNGTDVKLYSRNRLPQNYPAVADAIDSLPVGKVILDGEAAWDPASRVAYHIFDILWLEDRPVMQLPLEERRELLKGF